MRTVCAPAAKRSGACGALGVWCVCIRVCCMVFQASLSWTASRRGLAFAFQYHLRQNRRGNQRTVAPVTCRVDGCAEHAVNLGGADADESAEARI